MPLWMRFVVLFAGCELTVAALVSAGLYCAHATQVPTGRVRWHR